MRRALLVVLCVGASAGACTFREIRVRDGSVDAPSDLVSDAADGNDAAADLGVDATDAADAAIDVCTRERCGPPANDEPSGAVVIFEAAGVVVGTDAGDVGVPPADVAFEAGADATLDAPDASDEGASDGIDARDAADAFSERDASDAGTQIASHYEVPVDTVGATASSAPLCATNGGDVWYRFSLASRELVYADTHEASWDTLLSFADSSGMPIGRITGYTTCDANTVCHGDPGSQIAAVLEPGTYYIVVAATGATQGTTTLFVRHIPAPFGGIIPYGAVNGTIDVTLPGGDTVNGACEHAVGGENLYWWTTCPSYRGDDLIVHGCNNGGVVPQVTYTEGDRFAVCSSTPSDCPTWLGNAGAEIRTTLSAGAGLHALYTGCWYRVMSGTYTLTATFTPR
jgi:hypothetical protein